MRYLGIINFTAMIIVGYFTAASVFEFLWLEALRLPSRITFFYILMVTGYLLIWYWSSVPKRWVVIAAGGTTLIALIILIPGSTTESNAAAIGPLGIVVVAVIRLAILAPGIYSLWIFHQLINWKIRNQN